MGDHTVEKIGGTSMSAFDQVLDNVILWKRQGSALYNRVFVVSAYGGITNLLLEDKKSGAPGVYQHFAGGDLLWDRSLSAVSERLHAINASLAPLGLDVAEADAFVDERVDGIRCCLHDLRRLGSYGHFEVKKNLPVVRELLSSLGEAHSAFNSVGILRSRGVNAVFADLTGWMEENKLPLDAMISQAFSEIDLSRELPIATGYTKCAEGLMSTFDRGYSEITFSKIATVTGAAEGVIHKEYHLSSGDPQLVGMDRVRPIGNTNYDVADQLADLGMEAIHPKAAKGMERANIPIRVKNTFEPDHPGTLISNAPPSQEPRVEIICGRDDLVAIEVWDPDMVGACGYDYRLLRIFDRFRISYIAKNTNANTITHYVPRKAEHLDECVTALREAYPAADISEQEVALVSAIGRNMKVPGFLSRAANALAHAGINVLALDQCMRQVNMQFIVRHADFEGAIRALHRGLIETV